MNRQPIKAVPALYATIMPELTEIARACGYALAVHGSMSHDLDLLAAPWVFNALPARELVERIAEHVGGTIDYKGGQVLAPSPERKCHGRTGWSIYFRRNYTGPYIDISVMPRLDKDGKTIDEAAEAKRPSGRSLLK